MNSRLSSSFIRKYSAQPSAAKTVTISQLQSQYKKGKKITAVTAHDFITGSFAENSEAEVVLIGDSLAMVSLGHKSTNQLEFDEFVYQAKSVSRAVRSKFLVADMPFGSFEASEATAINNATKMFRDCDSLQALKIEGGREHVALIKRLDSIGISVVGHCGLTPQRYHYLGGYKLQGSKSLDASVEIFKDCMALQNEARVKMLVLECVPECLAKLITERLYIPTIGIGAGRFCSGQILVMADLLGMGDGKVPKFVKKYGDFSSLAVKGINEYDMEVKQGAFPGTNNVFEGKLDEDALKRAIDCVE